MKRTKEREQRRLQYLDEIVDLLRLHEPVAITQIEYKGDFFKIFEDSYLRGYCTYSYRSDPTLGRMIQRPNQLSIIDGDAIWTHAKEKGWVHAEMSGKEKRYKDISLLRTWWDAWIYAWNNHPKFVTHKPAINRHKVERDQSND